MKKKLLFLLFALAGLFGGSFDVFAAENTTSPYTGITIEQATGRTDLFLYNVESGYWLQENNRQKGSFNTRGNLDAHGFDVAITAIEGGYQINPKFGHNNSMNSSNWYLDTGDAVTAWTFNSITKEGVSNAYQIKSGDNWLHATPEDEGYMLICNDRELRATWQIVTLEERLNYLTANASKTNPIDATFLIKAFDLANEDSRMSAWTQEMDGGNSDWNRADDGDNGYRCLQAHGFWNSKTSSYTQTIADVPDGIYEFYCTGFYRDGNRDQCQERRSAGTETIRGFMFINNERAPLKSILDGAQSSEGNGFGYHNESYSYGYFPDGGDDVTRAFISNPNAYLNNPVRGICVGGTMRVGITKTEFTGGNDWVFFSRFRLRYLGPAGLSDYLDALRSAISSAEAFSGETTDVFASNLASALSAARALVDSRDTDAISAATGALNDALNAAQAVDVSALRATVALATAEGISIPTSVSDYLATGTTNEFETHLRLVRNLRKLNAIEKVDITKIACSEPTNVEADYFLYNVGAGIFFSTTADWGCHIAIDNPGMLIHFRPDGEWDGAPGRPVFHLSGNGWDGMNWQEEYWDKNGENKLAFVPVEGKDKVYSMCEWDNYNWHFVYDPADDVCDGNTHYWNSVQKRDWNRNDYVNNPYAQWMLVSPEAYKAAMNNATEANPLDVTFLIENPNFTKAKVNDADNWTRGWTGVGEPKRGADREPWCVIEWFEANADMKQTITGLTPGKYRVSCYGFFRDGSSDNEATKVKNGETLRQLAKVVAINGDDERKEALLPNVTSEAGNLPGIGDTRDGVEGAFANWPWQANEYFQTGLYKATTPVIEVGADGNLTIGVEMSYDGAKDGTWVVVGNFRLESLGPTSESVTVTSAGYATYCSNHALDFTSTDIKAYVGTKEGDKLTFTPAAQVPAGTGLLLVYEGGKTEDVPVIASASAIADNCLVGVNAETTLTSDDYILNVVNGGAGFYKAGTYTMLGAHKAYIPAAVGNGVKGFTIDFDDDATAIEAIDHSTLTIDHSIYNLAGQRLSKTQKGINIVNGNKILVK